LGGDEENQGGELTYMQRVDVVGERKTER